MRPKALAVASGCVALVLLWQVLTVRHSYGGNWTGLFCTGERQRIPSELLSERIYALPSSYGYDGQFYHYIAHEPLGRTQLAGYVDTPPLRYRRILVPALAYLLAAGQPRFIDGAYYAVVLLFIILGVYWTSRFAMLHRRHPLWGALFLAVPATLSSIDRMTVDVALAALCAGFAFYATLGRCGRIYMILIAAPLVRETGLTLTAAYCLWAFFRKDWRAVLFGCFTALPFLCWSLYVWRHFGTYFAGWLSPIPLREIVEVIRHPYPYPWDATSNALALSGDLLALAGSVMAVGLALRFGVKRSGGLLEVAVFAWGAVGLGLVLFGSTDVWIHGYGHARLLSPVVLFVALRGLPRSTWSDFAPIPLSLPRIALQVLSQVSLVVRGLLFG